MASQRRECRESNSAAHCDTTRRVESARILAVETSGRDASLAVLEAAGDEVRVVGEHSLAGERRTAQVLVPGVRALLERVGWKPHDVQLIAVVVGPGSFTGLRIGVTLAKTLGYATGSSVIGVDALAVLAHQAPPAQGPLSAVIDAQRQELFAARFECDRGCWNRTTATHIIRQEDWLAALRPGERLTGPALRRLRDRLPADVELVAESYWLPRASAVGQLGWRDVRAGRRDDVWSLAPQYYRASAAEEKRALRESASVEVSGRPPAC